MTSPSDGVALQIRNLRKAYGDVIAVDGLDLEIRQGRNTPDAGDVTVLGHRWGEDDRQLRELLGISLQETQFSEKLTVLETVTLFRSFYQHGPSPAEVIRMVP